MRIYIVYKFIGECVVDTKQLLVVIILLFSISALSAVLINNVWAQYDDSLKYNTFENKWENAGENDSLKYNAFENEWEYAGEKDNLKYNTFENKWEYADDNDTLKYNPLEDEWEYGE